MRLSQLFSIYPQFRLGQNPHSEIYSEILGVTQDSRLVRPGWVFVAIRGHELDGHQYMKEVCAAGASGLVVEDLNLVPSDYQGAVVLVQDTRAALEHLAAQFYGHPADRLFCVGVTGTNGKTSTTYLCEKILHQFGWLTGVMGTIDHHLGQHIWPSQLTTPDPLTLHRRLAEFCALGAEAAVFEVSSHALNQSRVDHIPFDVVVFTNLTRDHLDYHGSMENYFLSKERLFNQVLARSNKSKCWVLINGDDEWGQKIRWLDRAQVWTYGQGDVDLKFTNLETSFSGSSFQLETPQGTETFYLPMPGLHNVYNAVAALGVGLAAGASLHLCREALKDFSGVPGRLERVPTGQYNVHVFVDYAHTDDALASVLKVIQDIRLRSGGKNKIITVYGCGGDRDRGKRPLMAQAAVQYSDKVYMTTDNPRTESPEKILQDGLAGLSQSLIQEKVCVEVDRRSAISKALQSAHEGDVILVAGKGHENYQIVGQEKIPFSDVEVILHWVQNNKKQHGL